MNYVRAAGGSLAAFDFAFYYHLQRAVETGDFGILDACGNLNGLVGVVSESEEEEIPRRQKHTGTDTAAQRHRDQGEQLQKETANSRETGSQRRNTGMYKKDIR